MTATKEKQATLAQASQVLATGFDCGNGHTKTLIDLGESRQPSLFLPIQKSRILDIPTSDGGSLVEYIGGDRSDLIGKTWLTGSLAYQQSPQSCLRVGDDRRGKILYGLQLLLGAIGTFQPRSEWHLSLVGSIQDQQVYGAELRTALQGKHRVKFGSNAPCDVFVEVQRIMEEGAGVVVNARHMMDVSGKNILLDLGSGTTIASLFGEKGKLVDRKVFSQGVGSLIDAIASNLETRRELGQEGDREIIRAGIEDGSFRYGKTPWNFEPIYKEELKQWVQAILAPAIKYVSPWQPTASSFLATGGGAQLPMIADLLAMKGIRVVDESHWANCRGLARIAFLTLKGN